MGDILATIKGTMLVPGVSKNRRLYKPETISRGVKRMQERLKDPAGLPIIMRTHHDAGDDSQGIVGRITKVEQHPDGRATYEAKLFNNDAGRNLAPLLKKDEDGKSALRTTSIHGYWLGPVERQSDPDGTVETADDIEINSIDFTYSPGVPDAQIQHVAFESVAEAGGETAILETHEAEIEIVEEDNSYDDPFGEDYNTAQRQSMASKGQAMPGGRYPIATKSDLRKAIRAVGRGKGSHAEIRAYIKKRAAALGLTNMIPDAWENATITVYLAENVISTVEARRALAQEHYIQVCVGDESGDMFKICADELSPDILKQAIKRAGKLVGKIVSGSPIDTEDEDDLITDPDDINFKVVSCMPEGGMTAPDPDQQPTSTGETVAVENDTEESAMPEETKAAEAAPTTAETAPSLDFDKLASVIAASVSAAVTEAFKAKDAAKKAEKKAAESAAQATAETTKAEPAGELKETVTAEELKTRLAEERAATIAELRETILKENGIPQRQGYRVTENADEANKPLTGDDLWEKRGEIWAQAVPAFALPTTPAAS